MLAVFVGYSVAGHLIYGHEVAPAAGPAAAAAAAAGPVPFSSASRRGLAEERPKRVG